MDNGQWSVDNGQWAMGNGFCEMAYMIVIDCGFLLWVVN